MLKFKKYKDNLSKALVTYKIDGVRLHVENGQHLSRAGKPLYNLPALDDGIYEVYKDNWETSVSICRTRQGEIIDKLHIYKLYPDYDDRLIHGKYEITPEILDKFLKQAINEGFEGLVLRNEGVFYKIKPVETYDVEVTGVQMGTGRHGGRMGALITDLGKVGTGFTDKDRESLDWIGSTIEVACMSLTPSGKFRHPRFIRKRIDK